VFDEEVQQMLTYRELLTLKYAGVIPLIRRLDQALGRERTVDVLKAFSDEQARALGRGLAAQAGANDMAALRKVLTD